MIDYLILFSEYFLFIFLPALVLIGFLYNIFPGKGIYRNIELLLLSFGLGISYYLWFLNIILLSLSCLPFYFYILLPTIINLILIIHLRRNIHSFLCDINNAFKNVKLNLEKIMLILFIVCFLIFNLYSAKNLLITGSDSLRYANQGKVFALNRNIEYSNIYFDETTKFFYVAMHGFSYPLFATIENLFAESIKVDSFMFFKSVSNYYFLLISLLIYVELKKYLPFKSKNYSILGILFFILAPSVFQLIYSGSIDSYRIFLLFVSVILFSYFLRKKEIQKNQLLFLGSVLGLSSNSHIIGLISSLIIIFSVIFANYGLTEKIKSILILITLMIFFGAYHYPIQIMFGDGWIFNDSYGTSIAGSNKFVTDEGGFTGSNKFVTDEGGFNYLLINKDKLNLIRLGYLGQYLGFEYVGIINFLFPILFLIFLINGNNKLDIPIIVYYFSLSFVIAFRRSNNFRYSLTLLPITLILTLILFFSLDKKTINEKTHRFILFTMIITSIINFCLVNYSDFKNYINKYAITAQQNNTNVETIDQNIEKVVKGRGNIDLINFVERIQLQPQNNFLSTGSTIINYYTDQPNYYISSVDEVYGSDGLVTICAVKTEESYNLLINKYKIEYIVFRTTDKRNSDCLEQVINRYGLLIFDSGVYQIFKIKNNSNI